MKKTKANMHENMNTNSLFISGEMNYLYQKFPEDVDIAIQDAAQFSASLADNFDPTDEPSPPLITEMAR